MRSIGESIGTTLRTEIEENATWFGKTALLGMDVPEEGGWVVQIHFYASKTAPGCTFFEFAFQAPVGDYDMIGFRSLEEVNEFAKRMRRVADLAGVIGAFGGAFGFEPRETCDNWGEALRGCKKTFVFSGFTVQATFREGNTRPFYEDVKKMLWEERQEEANQMLEED